MGGIMELGRNGGSAGGGLGLVAIGCASPEQREGKYLESGKKFLAAKDYSRAVLQFRNAVKSMPRDPEPHYQLALAYLETANLVAAMGELKGITGQLETKHVAAGFTLAELFSNASSLSTVV